MNDLLLPILIAAAVALFAFGVVKIVAAATSGERRKLHQRLSTDVRPTDIAAAMAKPIVMQVDVQGLPPFLAKLSIVQSLHRKLMSVAPNTRVTRFATISVGVGLGLFAILYLVTASPAPATTAGLFGLYAPFFWLNRKVSTHQKRIAQQLPDALDFLTRVLRAGHSLTTGLQMMSEELPKPLSEEFRRAYDQHSLGQSLEDSLKDMATRIDSTDFAFFITAVLIQRQTGGDLSEVLRNISGMIRGRVRLQQHVMAKTAEGRFTGYVLVAFPTIMFFIAYTLNPGYAGVLIHSSQGRMLLAVAFGLQVIGLLAIRKITTIKV